MLGIFGGMFDTVSGSDENWKAEEERKDAMRDAYKESLNHKVTISKHEFIEKASEVLSNGRFMKTAKEHNVEMAMTLMLSITPVISELTCKLFDEEDMKNGRE